MLRYVQDTRARYAVLFRSIRKTHEVRIVYAHQ